MRGYGKHGFAALSAATLAMVLAGSAEAGPNINGSFKADVEVTRLDYPPRGVAQKYTWYEWQAGNVSRFDALDASAVPTAQAFRFLPGNTLISCNAQPFEVPLPGKKPKDYTYVLAKGKCKKKGIPAKDLRPVPRLDAAGMFAFGSLAVNSGACTSRTGSNSGTLWTHQLPASKKHKYTQVSVCVASDNSTPYWLAWTGPSRHCAPPHNGTLPVCEVVGVTFVSFTPGPPAATDFCPSAAAAAACRLQ